MGFLGDKLKICFLSFLGLEPALVFLDALSSALCPDRWEQSSARSKFSHKIANAVLLELCITQHRTVYVKGAESKTN